LPIRGKAGISRGKSAKNAKYRRKDDRITQKGKKHEEFDYFSRKTKPIWRRLGGNTTTSPRKSAQSAVQFEKTKPISPKMSISAFAGEDYDSKPARKAGRNKPNSPAFGGKSEAPLPSQGQARPRENGDPKSERATLQIRVHSWLFVVKSI
jgi:hypothetical protein